MCNEPVCSKSCLEDQCCPSNNAVAVTEGLIDATDETSV